MPRPISACIHPPAFAHNLAVVRRVAPRSKVWAVVKANAYGHGLARAFAGLRSADGFALLDLEEAVQLRELGWAGPLLLLEGFFCAADLDVIDHYSLSAVVHCDAQLQMIEAARLSKPVNIQLKMNSGMNRLGYPPQRYQAAWQRARTCSNIGQIALMTHFSEADCARGIVHQMNRFEHGAAGIVGPRCLANSAAVLWHPCAHADWVRPGILLYGALPKSDWPDVSSARADIGLMPAMTLRSAIIATQNVAAGESVGYGACYRARAPMSIGVVACGYADGYPRSAPNGAPVIVDGMRTQLVGRVSMDMMTVDLGPVPNAGIGAPVECWGACLPVDEIAHACGTVGYELLCALAQRVPVRME